MTDLSHLTASVADRARLFGVDEREVELEDAAARLVAAAAGLVAGMREAEGRTQDQLGESIGLSGGGRVSQYETGQVRHAISLKTLGKIAQVLGYSIRIEATKVASEAAPAVEVMLVDDASPVQHGRRLKAS